MSRSVSELKEKVALSSNSHPLYIQDCDPGAHEKCSPGPPMSTPSFSVHVIHNLLFLESVSMIVTLVNEAQYRTLTASV